MRSRKVVYAIISLVVAILLIIVGRYRYQVVQREETAALSMAEADAASTGLVVAGTMGSAPPGYRWTSRMTITPGVYTVDLRSRDGNGWSWTVDVEYNSVRLNSGSAPIPKVSRPTPPPLPIPLSKLPVMLVGRGDPAVGKIVFDANCAACHGAGGENEGGPGPTLAASGIQPGQVAYMIRNPAAIDPDSGMPRLDLSDGDVADVAAYVASLR